MKRLKYRHLFYGKIIPIVLSIFGVFFVMTPILDIIKSEWGYTYFSIGNIALFLLTFAVDYAVIHRLKPDEKKKIAEASPLKWEKLPDRMKKKFRINKKESLISMADAIGLELIVNFIVLLADGVQTMLVSIEVLMPVTLICLAVYAVWNHIWANVDDSAIYTKIEIDHSFNGEMTRGRRRKFIVFYLLDGKYVLETDGYSSKNIVVIKYKCFIRWEDADIFF